MVCFCACKEFCFFKEVFCHRQKETLSYITSLLKPYVERIPMIKKTQNFHLFYFQIKNITFNWCSKHIKALKLTEFLFLQTIEYFMFTHRNVCFSVWLSSLQLIRIKMLWLVLILNCWDPAWKRKEQIIGELDDGSVVHFVAFG